MDAILVEDDLSNLFYGFHQDPSILAANSASNALGNAWPDPAISVHAAAPTASPPSSSKSHSKDDAGQDQPATTQAMSREARLQKNRE